MHDYIYVFFLQCWALCATATDIARTAGKMGPANYELEANVSAPSKKCGSPSWENTFPSGRSVACRPPREASCSAREIKFLTYGRRA